jgi:hypothetical protein
MVMFPLFPPGQPGNAAPDERRPVGGRRVQPESVRAISVEWVIEKLGRARPETPACTRNRAMNFLERANRLSISRADADATRERDPTGINTETITFARFHYSMR